ncbi:hypothetical protein [Streptomyces roseolus]|uniref:hypothetical protein n=1 Tax=Streptomyces roseolus TaxID=67358 RepID=UPI001672FD94|nr:hypothetical protein [Streptomyces roseolus]GGR51890.1 hypothetical protein GCM10010282_51040 [Streptomyces roseolus]
MNIAERKRIHNKFAPYGSGPHPLDGRSVAEWVREARQGWPRVPVPSDPIAAARKVFERHAGEDGMELEISHDDDS